MTMPNSPKPAPERANPQHPRVSDGQANRTLISQTAYSDLIKGPSFDSPFSEAYDGLEVTTEGNVEIVTGQDNTRILPAKVNRIYPVTVKEIKATNTSISKSEIILWKE